MPVFLLVGCVVLYTICGSELSNSCTVVCQSSNGFLATCITSLLSGISVLLVDLFLVLWFP